MTKRLFVAFPIPEKYFKKILKNKLLIKENVFWVKQENYHITIYFLGATRETNVEEIKKGLEKIAKNYLKFNFIFEDFIFAPPDKEPNMMWAKFQENSDYNNLVRDIHEEIGMFSESKKRINRIPHVTLAKFKEEEITGKINLNNFEKITENIALKSFSLYESKPSEKGSNYFLIEEFNLAQK